MERFGSICEALIFWIDFKWGLIYANLAGLHPNAAVGCVLQAYAAVRIISRKWDSATDACDWSMSLWGYTHTHTQHVWLPRVWGCVSMHPCVCMCARAWSWIIASHTIPPAVRHLPCSCEPAHTLTHIHPPTYTHTFNKKRQKQRRHSVSSCRVGKAAYPINRGGFL